MYTRRTFHRILSAGGGLALVSQRGARAQQAAIVSLQPLVAQVKRLITALDSIGAPFSPAEVSQLNVAFASADEAAGVRAIQALLDPRVLLNVEINPESRLSTTRGSAKAELIEQGWRTFLVKVNNQAGDTTPFRIRCPQARPTGRTSQQSIMGVHDFTNGAVDVVEARDRWAAINMVDRPPLQPTLSGLGIEYRVLQVFSRDRGMLDAVFEADAGKGEQDLGFRAMVGILFDCKPSADVPLKITDVDGSPAMASLLITDAQRRVCPVQGKRVLPDLWFERQIYRASGETVRLAPGVYSIEYGRGPEYFRKRTSVTIGASPTTVALQLERWIDPRTSGYYSGDTHIHAAGCAHYESPYEGVTPEVMLRQVQGEALSVGDVLTWAPGYEYQHQFFSGHVHHIAAPANATTSGEVLRYDVEVSGFPSSHCGHLVLTRLRDQSYPGAKNIDAWPSWNLPILQWAKAQGAVTGYAHSAGGLTVDSTELPNYLMPRFDSSGANEYIVDVTHPGTVDFISGCDLWPFAELNIWYHTLNCGYRTTFVGETDFPCITDERVGGGRSYVKLGTAPVGDRGYDAWISGLKAGNSYVGDGRSHIMDFAVSSTGLPKPGMVRVTARVAARLDAEISSQTESIRTASPYDRPYWHLERARRAGTRRVPVELIVNGAVAGTSEIEADGTVREVMFEASITHSSWAALRILPSSHTNPLWVLVNDAPVRASKRSAQWCRQAVEVCWKSKSPRIRPGEIQKARAAFEHARVTYDRIVSECIA